MNEQQYLEKAKEILNIRTPMMDKEELCIFVDRFLMQRQRYLDAFDEQGSPLYIFDHPAIVAKAKEFSDAFKAKMPQVKCFYAMKSNNHPFMIKSLVGEGYGVDVSSAEELKQAMEHCPGSVIFSGPGKTCEELGFACEHAASVIVLLDSFSELTRLEKVALRKGVKIKAGVRLMIEEKGLWRKFGIPLKDLSEFFKKANDCSNVELCGLQFHSSWNLDAGKQVGFIVNLEKALLNLERAYLKKIRFIDVGGGYWPSQGEWMQPSATPEGQLKHCLDPQLAEGMDHRCLPSLTIEEYSVRLVKALQEHIFKHLDCDIYLEPGRWLSHEAMHILLKVIDKKADDVVVADGGINMIGWERYEMDYFPVINISRPALEERSCMVFGSLCTPHDIWGYSYFGKSIDEGDILLVPTQGAYTYSLRQEFIKPLPKEAFIL